MAKPTTKDEFAEYCLRRLGFPVIQIEVDPEQVLDRIDDGLSKYFDYHFDGSLEDYLVIKLTNDDIANGYVTLLDEVFSVISVIPMGTAAMGTSSTSNLFNNTQYQFFLNDFYNPLNGAGAGSLQYIETIKTYFATVQHSLVPKITFNFNRKTNRLYFNTALELLKEKNNSVVVAKIMRKLDVDTFPEVWDDEFLKDYCTALIKKQWGQNLKKFGNMNLPGGIQLNGDAIYTEAVEEITRLEDKLITDLHPPLQFIMG